MKCDECGRKYRDVSGDLQWDDQYVGSFVVKDVQYRKCETCGEVLLPPETAEAIEKRRGERKDELLKARPLRDFMTAAETAAALGISRQALHKHRRIRRGFIHQTAFGGGVVYLEESVKLFKATGDGRLPLCSSSGPHGTGKPAMLNELPDRTPAILAAAARREATAVWEQPSPEYRAKREEK